MRFGGFGIRPQKWIHGENHAQKETSPKILSPICLEDQRLRPAVHFNKMTTIDTWLVRMNEDSEVTSDCKSQKR